MSELPGRASKDNDLLCPGVAAFLLSATLSAGKKYVSSHRHAKASLPQPGRIQLQVAYLPSPVNDTCAGPSLTPGIPLGGAPTVGAFNDYQLWDPAAALPAFPAPLGQNPSTLQAGGGFLPSLPRASASLLPGFRCSPTQDLVLLLHGQHVPSATPGVPVILTPPCRRGFRIARIKVGGKR